MMMAWRHIHHNFFVDNYSPQENVDNDDGSRYYDTHDNFLVYGGNGMKNDFGGHDNYHRNNIYACVAVRMSPRCDARYRLPPLPSSRFHDAHALTPMRLLLFTRIH
jgi:hypothetical protein